MEQSRIDTLKNLKWQDLVIKKSRSVDPWKKAYQKWNISHKLFYLPELKEIELMTKHGRDGLDQTHVGMPEDIQHLGLGYKIYKALIHKNGHIYSSYGRRVNNLMNKIFDRLKKDPDIECYSFEGFGDLCFKKGFPSAQKQKLIDTLEGYKKNDQHG